MKNYFCRRLLSALPALLGVVTLVFLVLHLLPGDPVEIMLGENALTAQRVELREALHLNRPLSIQFGYYLADLSHLNLGKSIRTGEEVTRRIAQHLPSTILLSVVALLIALAISIPLGIFSAKNKKSIFGSLSSTFSLFGLAIPTFWLGPLLILGFGFYLPWFPISGAEEPSSIVLPALTLGLGMAALLTRITRTSVLDSMGEDFVRTAKAKGLSPRRIFFIHVLKNALLPIITVVGLQVGSLLAGAVITEKIFSWPGIGLELTDSIEKRDYPVVQGIVLTIAVSYVLINLLTDLTYSWVDPRIRLGKKER